MIVVCLLCWTDCVLVGLDWAELMLFLLLHITCLCIFMHTYFTFSIFLYIDCIGTFAACLFLSLSLVYISCVMASKCKSTSSWNPLRFEASTSSDPTPSHVQFCYEKAKSNFFENFSKRGVHSESQVILLDFSDTDLPTVIHSRGWESLCDVPVTCPSVLVQEFYSNMHGFDYSVPFFVIRIWGIRIVVTPDIVFEVLRVPRVEHLDYLGCERLRTVSKDELISFFCDCPSDWGDCQFTSCMTFVLHPLSYYNSITEPVLDFCFLF